MLKLATVLLPSSDFVTLVNQFPGGNAVEYWHAKGNFFITFTVYVDGKEIGKIHSNYVNQEGCIQVDFDDLLKFHNPTSSGIIIADYYHHKKIPIELYFANIHKKTGTYLAYPGQSFMGDQIYPIAHTEELENSLFWPGATINDRTKISIISINPYKASSFIQLHLFLPNGKREQSKTIKLKAFSFLELSIDEVFAEHGEKIKEADGQYSICVTSQFKTLALITIKDKVTGALTTIDHLHKYCMV